MSKDIFEPNYECALSASTQREKFFSPLSSQIPPLRFKRGQLLPNLVEDQVPSSTKRGPHAHQNFLKKSLNVSQEALDFKNSQPSPQMSATHQRSGSVIQFGPQVKKDEHSKPKKELVVDIPHSAKEGPAALQDLLRASNLYGKGQAQGLLTPQGMMSTPKGRISPYGTGSPKYVKESGVKEGLKELQEVGQGQIKGVVFSETRNKPYQKRFLAIKEQSSMGVSELQATPKTNGKKSLSPSKLTSSPQAKDAQALRESLSQHLQVKPPSHEFGTQSVKQLSPVMSEKKIIHLVGAPSPRMMSSALMSKRGISSNGNRVVNNSGEKEGKSPSRDNSEVAAEQLMSQKLGARKVKKGASQEEVKQDKPQPQPQLQFVNVGDEEEEYYKEFLGVGQQTFDFEKMVLDHKENMKCKKDMSMYISVASPSCRKGELESPKKAGKAEDQTLKGDKMLRSMFSFYAKESGKLVPTPTMDSSKNDKGSTTCNSLKLMKELSSGRKDEKKDEVLFVEEVEQGPSGEDGKNRRN